MFLRSDGWTTKRFTSWMVKTHLYSSNESRPSLGLRIPDVRCFIAVHMSVRTETIISKGD